MSFLLMAYRKLSLKRQINDLTYRQTELGNKLMQIKNQMSVYQQAKTSTEGNMQYMLQNAQNLSNNIFQMGLASSSQDVNDKSKALQDAQKTGNEAAIKAANEALEQARATSESRTKEMWAANQIAQASIVAASRANSIFSASQDQGNSACLKNLGDQCELEMANNNSTLTYLNAEYANVEKQESEDAKNAAPKFGQ